MVFFIRDRIAVGDVILEHFPTGNMLGDNFTKPLQGSLLRKLSVEIQRIPDDAGELDL